MSYVQLNVDVLRLATALNGSCLAVLMYLASRADSIGRSFPSVNTIVSETRRNSGNVYRALTDLEQLNWLVFLRKNERDMITGKALPNVYMLNPLAVGIRSNELENAKSLYLRAGGTICPPSVQEGSGREGSSHYRNTNQQQEPSTEPTTNNQLQNQQQQPAKSPFQGEKPQGQKASTPTSVTTSDYAPTSPTAQAQQPRRGAAAVRITGGDAPRFVDPVLVFEPLEDPTKESLAKQLGGIKIAIPLARGFIVEYGADSVQQALMITEGSDNVTRPGGFFRKILQSKLTELGKSEPKEGNWYVSGPYSDFIVSGVKSDA